MIRVAYAAGDVMYCYIAMPTSSLGFGLPSKGKPWSPNVFGPSGLLSLSTLLNEEHEHAMGYAELVVNHHAHLIAVVVVEGRC